MIYPSELLSVGDAAASAPSPHVFTTTVDHAVVYNPNTDLVYLSVWRSESYDSGNGPRLGVYAIGPQATLTIPLGLCIGRESAGVEFRANTANDVTGAPASDVQLTPAWSS